MDNSLNQSIIEKVITKNVAIHIVLSTMCPPPFEDKFKTESLCQKNTQTQNSEKSLNVVEPNNVNVANDTMNNTKTNLEEKSWRDITDPKLREKMRVMDWRNLNKEKIKLRYKKWYDANKDKTKIRLKEYRKSNKEKIYKQQLRWKRANKNNPKFKLPVLLRKRLNDALRNNYKSGSAVRDLGCTIDELKSYLESKFLPGMTWDNWTIDGWHIDHIKPLASFDLTDRKQLLEACHYTNLQPLWASDNLTKSDKII